MTEATEIYDPVREIERHTVEASDLLRFAAAEDAADRPSLAAKLRRRSAAHRAVATRIARRYL